MGLEKLRMFTCASSGPSSFSQLRSSRPLSLEIHTAGMGMSAPVTEAVPVSRILPGAWLTMIIPAAPYLMARAVFSERCRFFLSLTPTKPMLARATLPLSFPLTVSKSSSRPFPTSTIPAFKSDMMGECASETTGTSRKLSLLSGTMLSVTVSRLHDSTSKGWYFTSLNP